MNENDLLLRALTIARDALDAPAHERSAFVAARCAQDDALRGAVASLLDDIGTAGDAPAASREKTSRDEPDALLDTKLGPFRLVERIGRGGMGVVYRGTREGADFAQDVAVKLVRRGFDFDDVHARFLRERRILARLDHPNLARFIDGGVAPDGRPWFALEYVRGTSLVRWCDEHRLSLRERVRLFLEVCAAVQHAHAQLIVHRDLKPANILVDGDGHVRLLDFGIARLLEGEEDAGTTIAGRYAFTPEYAAPEQFGGDSAGVATDVYALGVILYELLSGALPYALDRHDLVAAERVVRTAPPLPLAGAIAREGEAQERLEARATTLRGYRAQTGGDLSRILDKALAKEPARRYASVEAFADDLRHWLDGAPVRVSGNGPGYRLRKFVARNRVAVGFAALAAFAVVAGLAATVWQMREARRQRDEAVEQNRRADREAARAHLEAERTSAVNGFLNTVFSGPDSNFDVTPDLTVAQALDRAVASAEQEYADKPQLAVRVLLAAANAYGSLGKNEKDEALTRRALAIQERELPDAKEDRGLLLSNLAYLRANYEPGNALQWAREAVALQKSANPVNTSSLTDALSSLVAAQFANDDAKGALETTQASLQVMREAHVGDTDAGYIGALSSVALMQAQLGRYDEAIKTHEEVIRLREKAGGDGIAVWQERVFFANTLRRAGQAARALAQLDQALPGLERQRGGDTAFVQRALMERGMALVDLGRDAEALAPLHSAHEYGQKHAFEKRQDSVAGYYLLALSGLGRCVDAQPLAEEIARRHLDVASQAAKAGAAKCPRAWRIALREPQGF